MDAILARRSIRKYTNQQVSEAIVKELLQAAMSAPSAGDERPWHFIVVRDRRVLDAIPNIHPYSHMLKYASVAILVCGDEQLEKSPGFWVQDCAAAAENILLTVQEKGLGAVWLGIYPLVDRVEGISRLFDLPLTVHPFCLIPVGYPAEEKASTDRYDEGRVHYDQW
jgi:nitroreductase